MSKLEFIASITEARMFRRLSQVKGESVDNLASRLFTHLLAVRALYEIDKSVAVKYVADTLQFPHFQGFKASSTDLYNLIVLVLQQYEHADKLFNNWDIVLPEMRIRRVLRSIESGKIDSGDFNELMLIIQRRTALTGLQISMRRVLSDAEKVKGEQMAQICRRLVIIMREDAVQSDLFILLRKTAQQTGYL